jgi:hypothetical protein
MSLGSKSTNKRDIRKRINCTRSKSIDPIATTPQKLLIGLCGTRELKGLQLPVRNSRTD